MHRICIFTCNLAAALLLFHFFYRVFWRRTRQGVRVAALLLGMLALFVSFFVSPVPQMYKRTLTLTATGEKNEHSADTQIYLSAMFVGGTYYDVPTPVSGEWTRNNDWYCWFPEGNERREQDSTDAVTFEIESAEEIELCFYADEEKGIVDIDLDGAKSTLDTYAAEDGQVSTVLPGVGVGTQVKAVLRATVTFSGLLFALLGVLTAVLIPLGRFVGRNGDAKNGTRAGSRFRRALAPVLDIEGIKTYRGQYTVTSLVCILFLCFSFYNDRAYFDFSSTPRISYFSASGNPYAVPFYIVLKLFFVLLVFAFSVFVAKTWIEIKNGNARAKNRVKIYLVLFAVYSITLIHVYPGIWYNSGVDEFQVYSFTRHLQIQYHQGPLASIAYILALMCYPKPVMVPLFQAVVSVLILGGIIEDIMQESKCGAFFALILFVSPAMLYFMGYPMRAYLFAVFFLAFIHYFLKYYTSEQPVGIKNWIYLTLLLCVVINYRTEAKFLLIAYPFFLWKKCSKKVLVRLELLALCSVILVSGLNMLGYQRCNKAHDYLFFSGPLSLFLTDETIDKTEWEDELQDIDKVLDLEQLRKGARYNYSSGERPDSEYTDEDVTAFVKSAVKIFLRYPQIYLSAKLLCARDSLSFGNLSTISFRFPQSIQPAEVAPYFRDVDIGYHNYFASVLAGDFSLFNQRMFYVFYAVWLPCLLLLGVLLIGLWRNKVLAAASVILIIQMVLTVLTAPSGVLMYYFVEYLAGWYLVIRAVHSLFGRRRQVQQLHESL